MSGEPADVGTIAGSGYEGGGVDVAKSGAESGCLTLADSVSFLAREERYGRPCSASGPAAGVLALPDSMQSANRGSVQQATRQVDHFTATAEMLHVLLGDAEKLRGGAHGHRVLHQDFHTDSLPFH